MGQIMGMGADLMIAYLNASQVLANVSSSEIINLTKVFNNVAGTTPVDRFMDSVSGVGHRIKHGHDLSYLPEIFNKFGISGVADYFAHIARDFMSPHGVPIPFAENLKRAFGFNYKQSIDWLSFNIGTFISGGVSIIHSAYLVKALVSASASGPVSFDIVINAFAGGIVKISTIIWAPNPLTLLSGIVDLVTLAATTIPFILKSGRKPQSVYPSATKVIYNGAIKGILLSFAVGFPNEAWRYYSRYQNGENNNILFAEFTVSILGLIISGAFSGIIGSLLFVKTSSLITSAFVSFLAYNASIYAFYKLKSPMADRFINNLQEKKSRRNILLKKRIASAIVHEMI